LSTRHKKEKLNTHQVPYVLYLQQRLLQVMYQAIHSQLSGCSHMKGTYWHIKYSYKPDKNHQFCSTAFAHRRVYSCMHTHKNLNN